MLKEEEKNNAMQQGFYTQFLNSGARRDSSVLFHHVVERCVIIAAFFSLPSLHRAKVTDSFSDFLIFLPSRSTRRSLASSEAKKNFKWLTTLPLRMSPGGEKVTFVLIKFIDEEEKDDEDFREY